MKFKVGDFVYFCGGDKLLQDYSVITNIYDNSINSLVVEALTEESKKYVGETLNAHLDQVSLVTDKSIIDRLQKIMVFK